LGQVVCPHRPILNTESGAPFDFMRGNSGCTQLRQDEHSVLDDIVEPSHLDPVNQLVGAKSTFAGCAPNVDAMRILSFPT
jgi:hypothetical protein